MCSSDLVEWHLWPGCQVFFFAMWGIKKFFCTFTVFAMFGINSFFYTFSWCFQFITGIISLRHLPLLSVDMIKYSISIFGFSLSITRIRYKHVSSSSNKNDLCVQLNLFSCNWEGKWFLFYFSADNFFHTYIGAPLWCFGKPINMEKIPYLSLT